MPGDVTIGGDYDRLLSALADTSKVRDAASKALSKAAQDVKARAQTRVPVDTGATKSSIHVRPHGRLAREVGPTTSYAKYLEYGTSRMSPRPYMRPALAEVEPGFVAAMTAIASL